MAPTAVTTSNSWSVNWTRLAYDEANWKPGDEPRRRRLRVVARFARSQWHIIITFEGSLHPDRVARANVQKRRQDLEDFCSCLDFDRLQLLNDTVTELLIRREDDTTPPYYENDIALPNCILPLKKAPYPESEYYPVRDHLQLCVREDPFHVRFPLFDYGDVPTKDLSKIIKTHELSAGVHEVRITGDDKPYVYKGIDRPLYTPRDSQVLDQELRNLKLFRGTKNVIQLVAAVISQNPYQTAQAGEADELHKIVEVTEFINLNGPTVLRGILLEYHPKGTLADVLKSARDALQSQKLTTAWPWLKLAFQIARALAHLHEYGVTHMDLKPSNVVISAEGNAVLTDISGIGGVTREWLAPEMRLVSDPLSESMDSRIRNDVWALGKLLLEMANASRDRIEKQQLNCIALGATAEDSSSRSSLHNIVSALFELSV